jgi:hypothetical protein
LLAAAAPGCGPEVGDDQPANAESDLAVGTVLSGKNGRTWHNDDGAGIRFEPSASPAGATTGYGKFSIVLGDRILFTGRYQVKRDEGQQILTLDRDSVHHTVSPLIHSIPVQCPWSSDRCYRVPYFPGWDSIHEMWKLTYVYVMDHGGMNTANLWAPR